jgi:hypothetical protein
MQLQMICRKAELGTWDAIPPTEDSSVEVVLEGWPETNLKLVIPITYDQGVMGSESVRQFVPGSVYDVTIERAS